MKFVKIAALSAALSLAGTNASAESLVPEKGPWHNRVEETERGHALGNPEAETTLIEFVSYTCSHCASFAIQGDPPLEMAFVSPGHVRIEVRNVIRNAVDLTVAMLVACGDPAKFKGNHSLFMRSQKDWLPLAANAPVTQQQIWARADTQARLNMASALGFNKKMEARGYTLSEVNSCLSDNAAAQAILASDRADREQFVIPGTPSFALNGELLANTHDWASLYPVLRDHVKSVEAQEKEPGFGESAFSS